MRSLLSESSEVLRCLAMTELLRRPLVSPVVSVCAASPTPLLRTGDREPARPVFRAVMLQYREPPFSPNFSSSRALYLARSALYCMLCALGGAGGCKVLCVAPGGMRDENTDGKGAEGGAAMALLRSC